tara:strand:- start:25 stop:138 length:114 start_codon:yes stop_codon:yes gene_type:complete
VAGVEVEAKEAFSVVVAKVEYEAAKKEAFSVVVVVTK